jgi:hypothetical protein
MGKKKYNPVGEVGKLSGSMVGTVVGVSVPHMIMGKMPVGSIPVGVSKGVGSATNLMGTMPIVGVGNSLINAVSSMGKTYKRKRR